MKKVISLVMAIVMVATVLFSAADSKQAIAANSSKKTAKDIKVGFLYVGPVGDGGWTYSHNEGRLYLEKKLGVKTFFKESVKEDASEVENEIERMIDQGANIIFGTSFGFMDGVVKAAKKHPDVKFMHCSGYKTAKNMSTYFGKMEQMRYLSGKIAAMKTKTSKIGYVAAFEIPEVIRGIDAFTLGVRSVNPKAVVKVRWTHTWYDPAKEKEAAKALLDEGVDVVAQHQDTAGPQQAAEERKAFAIGYNTDSHDKAPKAFMTAPIWNWGPYYVKTVQEVMNGTWKSEQYLGGLKEGMVDLAKLTANAPKGAKEVIAKGKADILSGKTKIFAGPIKDQAGKVRIKAGTVMNYPEILNINWFVQGVEGKIVTK